MRGCYLFIYFFIISACVLDIYGAPSTKIKNIVVLMEENRSFDHMLGWKTGVNGLTGKEFNLLNTSDPNSKRFVVDKVQPYIAPCDPDHSTPATQSKIFGADAVAKKDFTKPTMSGFIEWENHRGNAAHNYCDVMSMFTPDRVPIMSALTDNFAIMDRFFCAHPGPTWPNRLFMLSATSAGDTETSTFYHDKAGSLYPQKTFFDQLTSEGFTWKNYYNDTPWELFVETIATHPNNLHNMDQFYKDASAGTLPTFSWINPRAGMNVTLNQGSNDQHPDHDVALGERYYKDIYEALRASPQWNSTLFIVTYDEHGGYYDHVPPPLNIPPPGDGEVSYPDKDVLFDRLGVRIPTLLISPWIPKATVVSAPPAAQKPASNSEYTLTSIMATVRKLLGMTSKPLTNRDAWSATFEHVFSLSAPRTDCPVHLPAAPPPSKGYDPEIEKNMPINGLQKDIMTIHAHLAGVDYPSHITKQGEVSEWLQKHFNIHKEKTIAWINSKKDKNSYKLVLASQLSEEFKVEWDINNSKTKPFSTISLRGSNPPLCLQHDNSGEVGVSHCYSSADPDVNRDKEQQWIWQSDSTIRPYADNTMCITTSILTDGSDKIFLTPCNNNDHSEVTQRWSYNGNYDNNDNNNNNNKHGKISFGHYDVGVAVLAK